MAARRDIVARLPLRGEVIAPVARVLTTVAANVKRGDVLVELSHPTAQAAEQQARQALAAAETAYANAKQVYSGEVTAAEQRLAAARQAERSARAALQVRVGSPDEGVSITVPDPSQDLETAMQARFEAERAVAQTQARYEAELTPYRQQLEAARTALQDAQAGRKQAMIRAPIRGTVLAPNAQPGAEVGEDAKQPVVTIVDLDALQVLARMRPERPLG